MKSAIFAGILLIVGSALVLIGVLHARADELERLQCGYSLGGLFG